MTAATGATLARHITDEHATRLSRIYDAVSKNIERENALLNFRICWSIFLSAGIVGAETAIASYTGEYFLEDRFFHSAAQGCILLLSAVAIYFCWASYRGVQAAANQMHNVHKAYTSRRAKFDALGYPCPFGNENDDNTGDFTAKIFPRALMMLWCIFLGAQLIRFVDIAFVRAPHSEEAERSRQQLIAIQQMSNTLSLMKWRLDSIGASSVRIRENDNRLRLPPY